MALIPRALWLSVHKWIGLCLGIWIALQGLTGAFLVYKLEIQAGLDPQLYRTGSPTKRIDYDGMVESVAKNFPGYRIAYLERDGMASDEAFRFIVQRLGVAPSPFTDREVFVHPSTAAIVGDRDWLTFTKAVWVLHNGLIAGRLGEDVVGYLALVLLVSLLGGIIIWWPKKGGFRRALRINIRSSLPKLIRDLHTVSGIYAVVALLTIALTGLTVIFPKQAHAAISLFTEVRPSSSFTSDTTMPRVRRDRQTQSAAPSLNALAATIEQEYPRSTVTLLLFPHNSEKGTFTFRILPAGVNPFVYTTQVYMHPKDGHIIGRFDPANQPAANSFLGTWAVYLHTGHLGGTTGRLAVFASGLFLASLFFTGLYIWSKKRPAGKQQRTQQPSCA